VVVVPFTALSLNSSAPLGSRYASKAQPAMATAVVRLKCAVDPSVLPWPVARARTLARRLLCWLWCRGVHGAAVVQGDASQLHADSSVRREVCGTGVWWCGGG
jgi:hypothetical protein